MKEGCSLSLSLSLSLSVCVCVCVCVRVRVLYRHVDEGGRMRENRMIKRNE